MFIKRSDYKTYDVIIKDTRRHKNNYFSIEGYSRGWEVLMYHVTKETITELTLEHSGVIYRDKSFKKCKQFLKLMEENINAPIS